MQSTVKIGMWSINLEEDETGRLRIAGQIGEGSKFDFSVAAGTSSTSKPRAEKKPPLRVNGMMAYLDPSKYFGECPYCNKKYQKGEEIAFFAKSKDKKRVYHPDCFVEMAQEARNTSSI